MLYDLISCEHRPWMDLYGDRSERDQVSPFVQLVWERGHTHEREVVVQAGISMLDLSVYEPGEREWRTLEAMSRREPLIYQGRLSANSLVGLPDLLRFEEYGYVP